MWYLLCSCGYRLHIVQPQAFPIIKKHTHGVTHLNVMKTTTGLRIVRWFTRQMTVENYHAEKFEGVILVLCLMRQRSRLLLIWDWTFHKHHLIEHVRLSMNWSLRLWGTCIREWGAHWQWSILNDRKEALTLSNDNTMSHVSEGPCVQRMGLHPGQVCTVQLPD